MAENNRHTQDIPMRVLVGSENPIKIESVRKSFSKFFKDIEVEGMLVDSEVSSQPVNEDTFKGAQNRAENVKRINHEQNLGATFFVGIEGGILRLHNRWFSFSVIYILDEHNRYSFGTTGLYELPDGISEKLFAGKELGHVIDDLAKDNSTKEKYGAIGFLTKGKVDRLKNHVQGVTFALVPFIQENLYFSRL